MAKAKVIAIDGPSGSGKSTITKRVAKRLSLTYLDTGAMFRSIALHLNEKNIAQEETSLIEDELAALRFEYCPTENILVRIDSVDLSERIREHEVSRLASQYSQVSAIRNFLKEKQREIALKRPSILEGRDIGTIIFPDAALKIFLTARSEVRARRRLDELEKRNPKESFDLAKIQLDIEKRDEADKTRSIAPLVRAQDAIEIDTSDLSLEQISEKIMALFEERKNLFY